MGTKVTKTHKFFISKYPIKLFKEIIQFINLLEVKFWGKKINHLLVSRLVLDNSFSVFSIMGLCVFSAFFVVLCVMAISQFAQKINPKFKKLEHLQNTIKYFVFLLLKLQQQPNFIHYEQTY